jgi:hypothetical protein
MGEALEFVRQPHAKPAVDCEAIACLQDADELDQQLAASVFTLALAVTAAPASAKTRPLS